jgi:hypothetical protein
MNAETQPTDDSGLSDAERTKIRAEVRYALVAAREAQPKEPPKSALSRTLGFLSNGFVLLLVGSLITAFLVPYLQHNYENRKQQIATMQDCLGQFLLYSNSIWQEYYGVLPLTQQVEIDRDVYLQYLAKIAEIKLKRYDAYAKILALSVVFKDRVEPETGRSVNDAIDAFAVDLNRSSAAIDSWLTGLYCTPVSRATSPCAHFDPAFDAYDEHLKIKALVVSIGNTGAQDVAAMIVRRINAM